MPAVQSTSGYWVYKAEFDEKNNYNEAPISCTNCGYDFFRLRLLYWICDQCETQNDSDFERNIKYREMKIKAKQERIKKRGKRSKSKQDIEDEINIM
jgi:glutaredoxin